MFVERCRVTSSGQPNTHCSGARVECLSSIFLASKFECFAPRSLNSGVKESYSLGVFPNLGGNDEHSRAQSPNMACRRASSRTDRAPVLLLSELALVDHRRRARIWGTLGYDFLASRYTRYN
jgi:hypothetical protein